MTVTVRIEAHGPIMTMVLDRPSRLNPMSAAMLRDVEAALHSLALACDIVSGSEAHRIGLVAEVTEPGGAAARACELAHELADRSPSSIASIRALLESAEGNSLEAALADEADAVAIAFMAPAFRTALAAFRARARTGSTTHS